jgi:phosphomevalonate kinase
MNATFVARAPGKLLLLGEYAVLDGVPAIVAAIDRYVEVRLAVRHGCKVVRIAAPGHCASLEVRDLRVAAPPELRFALAAIDEVGRRLPAPLHRGLDLEIRSALADASGRKLGLGGSAAVTAAIVAALYAAAGCDPAMCRDDVFAAAFAAHRAGQGAVGSGADVAASVYGGLLLFQPQPQSLPRSTPLQLPSRAALSVAWSGAPAATAPLVRRYLALDGDAAPDASPRGGSRAAARADFVRSSRASVEAFSRAAGTGRLDLAAVNRNGRALERLARDADLPLLTSDLESLVFAARACGAGAKLSGAGGGDCVIALTDRAEVDERLRTAWRAASFPVVDLRLAAAGVTVAQA